MASEMSGPRDEPSTELSALQSNPNGQLASSTKQRLFISHFLSTWNTRVFEFGAVLYLATIFPGSLLPLSVYALARSFSAVVLSPAVGRYIDTGNRLQVVRLSIVVQRTAVAISCVLFYLLAIEWRGISGHKPTVLSVLALLACVEKLAAIMNLVSVERDWVIIIAGNDDFTLRTLNSQMRRIDLFCKLAGPFFIAMLDGISTRTSIVVNLTMNLASISVEYYSIAQVYNCVPELACPSDTPALDVSAEPSPSYLRKNLEATRDYFRHRAFLPSFAGSLLYLTVLNLSGQMITYLLSTGYNPAQIGVVRLVSVAFELSATWIAPKVMSSIGPIRAGIWFINWQLTCLAIGASIFWTVRQSNISAAALVIGSILSRVGLWGFDLSTQIIIQEATYSGIPVYEMMCKGVAVMRRRSDSWLNATQILKVAGFDKPQRTRVLEREVQKGEHEKVQGGYGKYQGTWIPLERGLALAKQYGCDHLLEPIIKFQPGAKSPPLAPKHLAAHPPSKPARKPPASDAATAVATRSSRRHVPDPLNTAIDKEPMSPQGSADGSMTPSPTEASSSSRTPSPIHSPAHSHASLPEDDGPLTGRKKTQISANSHVDEDMSEDELPHKVNGTQDRPPPRDLNPNMAIDDDDIFKVNKSGQTALMRSVMFANNYDVRKFPELYELLHRSTLNIDNFNRTVFHHIVDVAMSKGKVHAARYYMETVLNRLSEYPRELTDIVNFQDEDGETALTLAARCRSKRLVKLLIDHGADPKIANNDGKSTEDYILEDERFRSSPVPPSRTQSMAFRNAQAAQSSFPSSLFNGAQQNGAPTIHFSVSAQRASTRCTNDMANMLDSLAASFDQELHDKERDTAQAQALLSNIQQEILESQRTVTNLKLQADKLPSAKQKLENLKGELLSKMGKRYRLGWEKWLKDEEAREKAIRTAGNGELVVPLEGTVPIAADSMPTDGDDMDSDKTRGKRKAPPNGPEDISDLLQLHADIPRDEEGLRQACEALRQDISQFKKRRVDLFDRLATFQAEADTSARMSDYRRIIGIGCGGIPPSEVDPVLSMLLETLEAEEPSTSSIAWNTGRPIIA
ncbi:hypothetical protein ONZ45_g7653 [Pleurotus djamor]|nr:hypothetical protein ONZ45_g7653 [Pleurotus djamor]